MTIRKKAADFFRSRKTALALLLVFLVLLTLSVIFPQKIYYSICEQEALTGKHPVFMSVISRLALDNVVQSVAFYVCVFLLCTSVLICTGTRAIRMFFSEYFENADPVLPDESRRPAPGGARKPVRNVKWKQSGSLLFHASILVMAAGFTISRLFGFHGLLTLTEGQSLTNDRESFSAFETGAAWFENRPTVRITLHRISRTFSDGSLTGFECQTTFRDHGQDFVRTIRVNQPVRHNGEEYLIAESGYAPRFILSAPGSNQPAFHAYVNISAGMASGADYFDIPGQSLRVFTRFPGNPGAPPPLPSGKGTFGVHGNSLRIKVMRQTGAAPELLFLGNLAKGQIVRVGNQEFGFDDVRNWVILRVTRDPGRPITFAGFWLCAAGLIMRFAPVLFKKTGTQL